MGAQAYAADAQRFVTSLYTNLLYRDPEPAGLAYWSSVAQQPGGCFATAVGIANSAESRNLDRYVRGPIQLTQDLYGGLLGRSVESSQAMNYWVYINNAYGRTSEVYGIASSLEFKMRCAAYGLN